MGDMDTHLAALPAGARCRVRAVHCERSIARRLMEMGLLPGTTVEVVRIAPMGDPVELHVRGYHLSIRKQEARGVGVDRVQLPSTNGGNGLEVP